LLIFRTEVSCFSVTPFYLTLFCCGGKANLVQFTLFYSTLLTLTDGMTDGGTHTLASCGLEEPFFQLCCCVVSVFGSGGKKVLIYIHMHFFITTEKKKILVFCLAGAQSLLRPEKKVLVVCLAGVRSLLRTEKKF
jgi:hypothetical protein